MKTLTLDPANTCTHCPHSIMDIGRSVMYCPCEDCHPGGLVQGREPKVLGPAADMVLTDGTLVDFKVGDDEDHGALEWVDPLHSLD